MARIDEMIKKLSPELQLLICNIRQWNGGGYNDRNVIFAVIGGLIWNIF